MNMQSARIVFSSIFRRFSTEKSGYVLEQLTNRSLISVSGDDASSLLQGLITNDMQHLSYGAGSMFAMFLNSKGRVLYDTIVYRQSSNTYYVEVDRQASDTVRKHISIYRLRRKIDISSIDDKFKVWVHFSPLVIPSAKENPVEEKLLEGKIVPCTSLEKNDNIVTTKSVGGQELLIFRDPRLTELGSRIIAPTGADHTIAELFPGGEDSSYKSWRYKLGVGEGVDELPPGNCFPLEANCDYLHGISFHKGCYIGQELTARTHHTGVVRKRLMPLYLSQNFKTNPGKDEIIKAGDSNVGKLRGFELNTGLGLLRIAQAIDKELIVNNIIASTTKPGWWPQELPKEIVSSSKV